MSRMIPPRAHPDTAPSEGKIFQLLASDPATDGWTVLHSLGLSRRGHRRPYGEIDFVILVPDLGILCLEVKGGRIKCQDGVWLTRDRYGCQHAMSRSPFLQAREGAFELKAAIEREFSRGSAEARVPVCYGVVFPDSPAPPTTPEFEWFEVLDFDGLRQPISRSIRRMLEAQRAKIGASDRGDGSPQEILTGIRTFLRPDFDTALARAATIRQSELRLLELTEDQYHVLDLLEVNPRTFVDGAAGTGKTMLALEYARRQALAGRRTLLLCYNRLLGDWLGAEAAGVDRLVAGSFHRLLRQAISESPLAAEFQERERAVPSAELFREVYPLYGIEALGIGDLQVDTLVVDEAQDLVGRQALDVLSAWVRGGLAGGSWAMFGDFTRQAIYGTDAECGPDGARHVLQAYCDFFTTAPLRTNCRNTRPIGEETALVSGFAALPYRLARADGLPVDYRYWKDDGHQAAQIVSTLDQLIGDGVDPADVVLLSPRRLDGSAARLLPEISRYEIVDLARTSGIRKGGTLPFSTIHAFKGMESATVVLCDVDRLDAGEPQALLYVGMSRARSHLVVLLHDSLRQEVLKSVHQRLTAT